MNVAPVIYKGVRYEAPHFYKNAQGEIVRGGMVVAYDQSTEKKLWEVPIYRVKYASAVEMDIQDIFITNLSLAAGKLRIKTERGGVYTLDPATRKVR